MQVFIVGGAGGVGRRLVPRLVERGHAASGMHRRAEQAGAVTDGGGTSVLGDLIDDSTEHLAELMGGHDAVVFSAGAHGTGTEFTNLIDGEGLRKSVAAARQAGITRFVLVSVFPDARRDADRNDRFEHYMKVKKDTDVHLAGTDLDWVIVRPGTLRDEPANGRVRAGLAIPYGNVRRGNVAAFIAAVLDNPDCNRVVVEVTDGDTPVDDAVTAIAGG